MSSVLTRMKWWLMKPWILYALLLTAAPASAQVSGPSFVFISGTVINPDEVNTNFSDVYDAALNRFGGTVAGHLTWSPDGTFDIGASGANRPRDLFLQRDATIGGGVTATALASTGNTTVGGTLGVTGATTLSSTLGVTGAATFTATVAVNSTSASALDVAGGIQAGSGNVSIVGTDGRIPGISSTTFASLSGANLTGILEANIADGTVFPRIAANETITGFYTFADGPAVNNTHFWEVKNSATSSIPVLGMDASNFVYVGPSDAIVDAGCCLQTIFRGNGLIFETNNTTRTSIGGSDGTLTHNSAVLLSARISPSTLAGGNNNDYAPASFATTRTIRLQGNAITPSKITGIAGGVDGREIRICNVGSDIFSLVPESASSTSSMRISGDGGAEWHIFPGGCTTLWYDGANSRWRPDAGAQSLSPL